jgi:cyclopropane fatty-acyl-phospholipid synthase-like methyltransferase
MPKAADYDKDYFENGVATGKSGYDNYRWLPELTIKLAYNIIKYLGIKDEHAVLDYGCAKGYLVKALRILDIDAYGADISEYAINMADSDVRQYCRLINSTGGLPFERKFDWLITKDVLEHMTEDVLGEFLKISRSSAVNSFHVVPLGHGDGHYIVPSYDLDLTHTIAQPADWWIDKFTHAGWKLKSFSHCVPGVKENWTSQFEKGNGFFVLE